LTRASAYPLARGSNIRLVESFFQRGLGAGTRHRGAAVVVQLAAAVLCTPPSIKLGGVRDDLGSAGSE
jgi:hypothetical protein